MPPTDAQKVALIGFTGVGKTQVGLALSGLLGFPFFDLDAMLEKKNQMSVSGLIGRLGLERFRDEESAALLAALTQEGSAVIATGAGTLARPGNRSALASRARCAWLRAKPETIWNRIQDKPYVAPLFYTKQDPLQAISVEMAHRERHYREAAACEIAMDGKTPEAAAGEIRAALQL